MAPVAAGLAWGQAVLLGQFLLLGTERPVLRTLLAAGWFALLIYLGEPGFAAIGGANPLAGGCLFLGVPFGCSAAIAASRRPRGCRIRLQDSVLADRDCEAFQFSLRHLFALTLVAAVVFAVVRWASDAIEETSQVILLFGLLPLANVFLLLPLLGPWAALGARHPGWRCDAVILFALVSAVGPVFIGKANSQTYWMLVCPAVLPSLVVLGSLRIARSIGYRYVIDRRAAYGLRLERRTEHPTLP